MKHLFPATAFAVLAVAGSVCLAQSSTSQQEPDQATEVAGEVSSIDDVESEFRELICSRAADFSRYDQPLAISVAVSQKYVDARFNEVVRQVMRNSSKPSRWNLDAVQKSEQLLPLTTLTAQQRAELAFNCFLECGASRTEYSIRKELRRWLESAPDETSRLILQRLGQPDPPVTLFPLVTITGDSTRATLPLLMKYAQSDDEKISATTISVIPGVIDSLRQQDARAKKLAAQQARGGISDEDLDPKLVAYAKRIVQRSDLDGDLILSPQEYAKMLMSPATADANDDGNITVNEYAAWMKSARK